MGQKCTLSGGSFQDALGNPLALGTVIVYLQQDVNVGVQVCAGIKDYIESRRRRKCNGKSYVMGTSDVSHDSLFRDWSEGSSIAAVYNNTESRFV